MQHLNAEGRFGREVMIQARLANADLVGDILKAETQIGTRLDQIPGDLQYLLTGIRGWNNGGGHLPTIR